MYIYIYIKKNNFIVCDHCEYLYLYISVYLYIPLCISIYTDFSLLERIVETLPQAKYFLISPTCENPPLQKAHPPSKFLFPPNQMLFPPPLATPH